MSEGLPPAWGRPRGWPLRIVSTVLHEQPHADAARRLSGFACIRCACTVYEYCRLDSDGPEGDLFLLCIACRKALNALTHDLEAVLALLRRKPLAQQPQFDRSPLPYARGYDILDVSFAFGPTMRSTIVPIVLAGKPVLSLFPPEVFGGPAQMTLVLGAADGAPIKIVEANRWTPAATGWRFERLTNRYGFESPDGAAALRLAFLPDAMVRIDFLRCRFAGSDLEIDERGARLNGLSIAIPDSAEQVVGVRLS